MRLRYLELHNYRKFRHAALELGEGVTGILGQNGVGKSTLVEALAWALFGNEASIVRTTKEGVRSAGAGPQEECSVTLEFDLEGDRYRLTRSLKGKDSRSDATLLVNDMLVARTDKGVTEAMEKRLGMDHKSFFVSVFARQKELNALSNLRPAQRRELILRMLGVGAIDTVLAEISSDLRSCRDGLEALTTALTTIDGKDRSAVVKQQLTNLAEGRKDLVAGSEALRSQMEPIKEGVGKARGRMEEAESRAKAHSSLTTRAATTEAEMRSRRARLLKVDADLNDLEGRRGDIPVLEERVAKIPALREERERLEGQRLRRQEMESLVVSIQQRSERLGEIETEMGSVRKELEGLGDPDPVIASLEEAIRSNSTTVEEQRVRLSQDLSDRKRYEDEAKMRSSKRDEIVALGPESECPTCERKLDAHYDMLLEKMDTEVADLHARADLAKGRADEAARDLDRLTKGRVGLETRHKDALRKRDETMRLRARLEALTANLAKVRAEADLLEKRRAAMGDVTFDQERFLAVKEGLEDMQRNAMALTKLRTELARTDALGRERQQLVSDMEKGAIEEGRITEELANLSFRAEEVKEAREQYVQWRDRMESAQRRLAEIDAAIARTDGEERAAKARLEELEETVRQTAERRERLTELNVLADAMRDFRANIITRVVPSISQISSEFFVDLTDGKYGGMRLDDEYELHIMDEGQEYPLDRFSGGEVDLASLSLRLAISKMIGERSGHHVNLLVLDEIFGSQDQNRKRNVLEMLSSLQRQFGQIMVITHIEDIKDALGNSVTVQEDEDGYSRVIAT
jgi:exonuclease SbcC